MSDYSASVAYGEPVLVDENDEIINYPSASASYLNPANDSVSVVDSYFFDIIDELAQDPDFIQDFGPVAMPIAQTANARPVIGTEKRPPVSAMSFAVADGFVEDAGIIADSASYVGSPSFSDSFYFNVIEDQLQIHQYNQFLLDEEKKKQALAESKQSFYSSPVTYAIPASTFEKALDSADEKTVEVSAAESKCCLAEEDNYGWNEKASALEFAPMKAPRLSKKMTRAIKQQKNNVKAVKLEKTLKVPNVLGNFKLVKTDGVPVATAAAAASGTLEVPVNAKSRAASMRQRVEGKFKKLQTKWVSATDFFVKNNSNSPVSPYSSVGVSGVKAEPGRMIDILPNYHSTVPTTVTAAAPVMFAAAAAPPRGMVVNHVWNKWNQPPLDYGLPSGMHQQQHYGGSSGSSSSSSSYGGGYGLHPGNLQYHSGGGGSVGGAAASAGVGGGTGGFKSRFGKLDLSSDAENS